MPITSDLGERATRSEQTEAQIAVGGKLCTKLIGGAELPLAAYAAHEAQGEP